VHMTTSLRLVIYDIDESLHHPLLMDCSSNRWTDYLRCGHVDVSCPGLAYRSLSLIRWLHIDSNLSELGAFCSTFGRPNPSHLIHHGQPTNHHDVYCR
jgi:hypothetical protein